MPMNLTFLRQVALAPTPGLLSSFVNSPSVAALGQQIYYSGNQYAARSQDNGATWQYYDPNQIFPAVPGTPPFYGNQTLITDRSRKLTIWVLEYRGTTGSRLRIAVKGAPGTGTGSGLPYDSFNDVLPSDLNPDWANARFGRNTLELSNQFLYVTANVYFDRAFLSSVVLRIPLDGLAAGTLTYTTFTSTFSALRCTAGARDVMYIGSNQNNGANIQVFTWPESSSTPTASQAVAVAPWAAAGAQGFQAPLPNGQNWLASVDDRISAAFLANGMIGFLWTSNAQPQNDRPLPYIRAVCIDAASMQLLSEPDLYDPALAFAFPDAAPNNLGLVGIAFFAGGTTAYPSPIVGVTASSTPGVADSSGNYWVTAAAQDGAFGPSDGTWGEYLTCRAADGTWAAAGYTLQQAAQVQNIQPLYVRFGSSVRVRIVSANSGRYLSMDGRIPENRPHHHGYGTVSGVPHASLWGRFILEPQADGTVAIQSHDFPNIYLRMTGSSGSRGIVNCQYGAYDWEKFLLRPQADGTIAIESNTFRGSYLSMGGAAYHFPPPPDPFHDFPRPSTPPPVEPWFPPPEPSHVPPPNPFDDFPPLPPDLASAAPAATDAAYGNSSVYSINRLGPHEKFTIVFL